MKEDPIGKSIKDVFSLYEKFGNESYGERVSQLQHMLQCAAIARNEGADDEMILAAFFHDIGHLLEAENTMEKMGKWGMEKHDHFGGEYILSQGFSERIAKLVAGHVKTKRYLTFARHGYFEELSEASKTTLTYQGGKMSEEEAKEFEKDSYFNEHIKMREWDDLGKIEDLLIDQKEIDQLKELAYRHLVRNKTERE